MRLSAKDGLATALTALAVLTFAATQQGWNVWLVGSSHRWASVAIGVLGMVTCSLGQRRTGPGALLSSLLGTLALALLVWAVESGSLAACSLLLATIVALWLGATLTHVVATPHHASHA